MKVFAGTELTQLCHFPMAVAAWPHPFSASNLAEQVSYIRHEPEWGQLFNVQPLTVLLVLHGLQEPRTVCLPFTTLQTADLVGIVTTQYVGEVPSLA